MEPQNFSVNDGEGIRTVIFFGGCPLRCAWCANPESSVGFDKEGDLIRRYSAQELLNLVDRQKIFYRDSGGVTFSGGEPALQAEVLRELSKKLYDRGINLAIETSGFFEYEKVQDILEKMELIFVDLKHMDEAKHKAYTGFGNKRILENIKKMDKLGTPMVIRIPVIETFNADEDNIRATAKFAFENIQNPQIELLPYHALGDEKYKALGMRLPSRGFKSPSASKLKVLEEIIESEGVKVASYR